MPQLRRLGHGPPRRSHIAGTRLKTWRLRKDGAGNPMKLFSCQACGQLLYFENIRCENCGRALGYLTDLTEISALEPAGDTPGWKALAAPYKTYKFCNNYDAGMCNWLVPA